MTVVDSSVWVDYFNGVRTKATDRLDAVLGSEPLVVGDLILAEVLQGFRSDADARTALGLFSTDCPPLRASLTAAACHH